MIKHLFISIIYIQYVLNNISSDAPPFTYFIYSLPRYSRLSIYY